MSGKVPVMIDGRVAWQIFGVAEKRGMTLDELLVEAVLAPPKRDVPNASEITRARIRELVLDGVDDGAISVAIDRTRGYVADVRRGFGLKPNRRKKPA